MVQGGVTKVLNYNLDVSEFKLQSHYYIHFQANTFGKGMMSHISLAIGSILSLLFFYSDNFGIK